MKVAIEMKGIDGCDVITREWVFKSGVLVLKETVMRSDRRDEMTGIGYGCDVRDGRSRTWVCLVVCRVVCRSIIGGTANTRARQWPVRPHDRGISGICCAPTWNFESRQFIQLRASLPEVNGRIVTIRHTVRAPDRRRAPRLDLSASFEQTSGEITRPRTGRPRKYSPFDSGLPSSTARNANERAVTSRWLVRSLSQLTWATASPNVSACVAIAPTITASLASFGESVRQSTHHPGQTWPARLQIYDRQIPCFMAARLPSTTPTKTTSHQKKNISNTNLIVIV